MVFERRSTAGVLHRAPPLPIIGSNRAGAGGRRSNGSAAKRGTPSGQQQRKSITSCKNSFPPTYSSSYTNGFAQYKMTPPSSGAQQQAGGPQSVVTSATKTRRPLGIDEYERDLRQSASELDLVERVFRTGLASNQLRSALWPYLFGLVQQRGRFVRCVTSSLTTTTTTTTTTTNNNNNNQTAANGRRGKTFDGPEASEFVYIEHEDNVKRWRELDKLYKTYENQWQSIQPDQELRFSTFRERKSLIERDVIRSDRSHPFYSASNQNTDGDHMNSAENLSNLTKVLMTYMMYDFDIGYLQGMSDLAAPILYVFQGDVVKTFWVFVEVMKLLRRNFEFSQKTIHFQLNCLFRLIKLSDPKLAAYLRETECSNCFFVFRHIVCQFKRELMRASSDSQPSTPGESSASGNEDDFVASSTTVYSVTNNRDDYANVLNLWDTIWFVQRRHELRAKRKCVHTFKIAHSAQKSSTRAQDKQRTTMRQLQHTHFEQPRCHSQMHQQQNHHCNNNNTMQNNHNNTNKHTYHNNGIPLANGVSSTTSNTASTTYLGGTARRSSTASSTSLTSTPDSSSISSISTDGSGAEDVGPLCCCSACKSNNDHNDNRADDSPKVKQEQVVYTKETFYSSFDPNQADIPRFELTETEKFVISLCMSLIKRERNYILQNRLDASEIHQHFIRPRLASDMDQFLGQAYAIYDYLNNECDLQALVKGASEFANLSELSPDVAVQTTGNGAPHTQANGCTPDELASSSAANTYDLLKDYFIISPTAYNISMQPLNPLGTTDGMDASPTATHAVESKHQPSISHMSREYFPSSTPSIR